MAQQAQCTQLFQEDVDAWELGFNQESCISAITAYKNILTPTLYKI